MTRTSGSPENMTSNKIWEQIKEWHVEERRAGIRRAFDLGDMIINAVIATRLTEYEVIRRIIDMLGDLAMGVTSYNRAARMARIFTANQRYVLIEKCLPLEKAEMLAGERYEQDRKRIKIISDIKAGKIVAPWNEISVMASKRRSHADGEAIGVQSLLEADTVLKLSDDTETVCNKLRSFLSRRKDSRAIVGDLQYVRSDNNRQIRDANNSASGPEPAAKGTP